MKADAKRLTAEIDKDLAQEFKAYCAKNGTTVKDEILALVKQKLNKH